MAVKSPGIMECFNTEYGMLVDNCTENVANAILKILQDDELMKTYKDNLKAKYSLESLFEKRLEIICSLFDDSSKIR